MKLTIIQDIIHWADKQSNLDKTQEQLETLAGKTDLVILPEMFSTGFCTNHPELAEDMEENTVKTLKKWALNYGLAIAGSFIATENGKLYNRGFFVFPNGEIATADKRHLFSMGGEDRFFSAGNDKLTVSYQGFNIRLLICYDVRFPVWSRNVNNEYDLLIYMANFPKSRISSWDILLPARAVENQAYVCGVNCIGTDGNGIEYNGHSALFDFKGNKTASSPDNETSIITTEILKEKLDKFRQKAAFWKDADNFTINL
ncbi:MAG: nitrilase family protein [Paludibacter sp.]|nr:nitrilase family protein [Paludibacter sp.]